MTQAGTVLGSPSYMSPEQVRGLSLDGRSDLFSAAVVFFEMITRERPFAGNDIATTMYRIAHEPPTPPSQFNPAIGPEISTVLERAFAKNPADRYQTGADFVAELRAAAALGPARGSSPSLAALAAAPPPVPPIVAPVAGPVGAAAAELEAGRAEFAHIPVTESAEPLLIDSSGHALAPIPGAGSSPSAAASPSGSNLALPTIPLPPETNGPSAPRRTGARPAKTRGRGLVIAGAAGAVVVLGIAGALFFQWSAIAPTDSPPAAVVESPAQEPSQPAAQGPGPASRVDAPAVPAPPVTPAPAAPPAAGRGGTNAAGRGTATSTAGRAGSRPAPPPAAAASPPAGSPPAGAPVAQSAPVTAAPGRVYLATEVDVKPEVLTQVAPLYPDDAAKQNVQDVVVLQVLVDSGGRPQTIRLLRGSRKAPLLDGAAAAAVRQWTFKPAMKNGEPVACMFNVGVPFPPAK